MRTAPDRSQVKAYGFIALATLLAVVAAGLGFLVPRQAPGLELGARDWLFRRRGNLPPSSEIVIVAIDELSLARFGRFPWPRSLSAQALRNLSAAQPKAIALDVLYSEPSYNEADDRALTAAVAEAGDVVVAAQLAATVDEHGAEQTVWLRPLPALQQAAAGVGHVNVLTGDDGVARALLLQQSDDAAQPLWALAVETLRVGEHLQPEAVRATPTSLQLGRRAISLGEDVGEANSGLFNADAPLLAVRPALLWLDFAGPTGSFAAQTFSFADAYAGRIPAEALRGKYVLVGATAAALGDRVATPFIRAETSEGRGRDELMPGVEILANALNTLLQQRLFRETPAWAAFLWAGLTAAAAMLALTLAQGRRELSKQLLALAALCGVIVLGSQWAFNRLLVFPPLAPMLIALLTAAPFALLLRSLAVSAQIDRRIAELAQAGAPLLTTQRAALPLQAAAADTVAFIAQLAGAEAAALFSAQAGKYRFLAAHGAPGSDVALPKGAAIEQMPEETDWQSVAAERFFAADALPQGAQVFAATLNQHAPEMRSPHDAASAGLLALAFGAAPSHETLLLCRELAAAQLAAQAARAPAPLPRPRRWWPRGGAWKAEQLGALARRGLERARFVEHTLLSVEDGLLVADLNGRIQFANPRAAEMLNTASRALVGAALFERLAAGDTREWLRRLLVERAPVERELSLGAPASHHLLRLAVVRDERETPLGLVAALTDVTKQRALQQTRNDVMALVTHELKTPLTAIQGMSGVLAEFDDGRLAAERRRAMHSAINDEARRLARMIDAYLNLARLESGAQPLRLASAHPAQLIERALLLLDPLAAQRDIRLTRRLPEDLPPLLADADLLTQALTNLVSNALKFSPAHSEVVVTAQADETTLRVTVADQGCGIPAEALPHLFEKFYRVPRAEQSDVPGTGLGLALVREVAEQHGGRVTVESRPVESQIDGGSVFTLHLPLTFFS